MPDSAGPPTPSLACSVSPVLASFEKWLAVGSQNLCSGLSPQLSHGGVLWPEPLGVNSWASASRAGKPWVSKALRGFGAEIYLFSLSSLSKHLATLFLPSVSSLENREEKQQRSRWLQ